GPGDPPQWRGCGSSAWVSPSDSERGSPSQVTREITTVPRIATFRRSTTPTTDRPQRVDESLQAAEAQLGDHRQDRHRQATDEHPDLLPLGEPDAHIGPQASATEPRPPRP